MPRPAGTSHGRYLARAALSRAGALKPVSCLRERVLAARAAELEGPAPDGLPLPPARLRVLVDGSGTPEGFLAQSDVHARLIRDTLASADVHLERLGAILDFGCGCGRTARRWASLSGPELHGCDYNPQLVAWCREHLPFMEARVNALEPPAPYPDESLDLVYALSILTHLPDDLAHGWVAEWARILKPGGLLLVTTHGDAYRPALGRRAGPRYDAGQAVVVGSRMAGANACTAHHPPSYVTERLLTAFEPVAFVPGGSVPHFRQDVHLARLRST